MPGPALCDPPLPRTDPAPVLYPNLAELGTYMGLSLDSEEVQKNLELVPASSVSRRLPKAGIRVPIRPSVMAHAPDPAHRLLHC